MKFLPDGHVCGKIVNKNNTMYLVWDKNNPHTSFDGDTVSGYGIEVAVINPTTKYLYSYEFPTYQKFLNPPKFIHMHGVCPGSIVTSQLPLFHVYQTYPYWKRMYANEEFDHYIMMLVGVSLFDYRLKFNMPIALDESQSNTVQRLAKLFGLTAIAPEPIKVKINNEDQDFDYKKWGIEFKINELEIIEENYLYLGESLSRYEINNAISGLKDLPRFWEQRNHRSLDVSDIVCENQMVLF
jgi:hypothetical protein